MGMALDLLFKGARIVDGTGNPFYFGDIGILNGKICCIDSHVDPHTARRVIAVDGLTACPGFFDAHCHDDSYLLLNPGCDNKVLQGVTTNVIGNCGFSLAPISPVHLNEMKLVLEMLGTSHLPDPIWENFSFKKYVEMMRATTPGINIIPLIGHNTIRVAAMGMENRVPSDTELGRMKEMVREAMQSGAFGISTGLVYAPGCYAGTEEIIEMAKGVAAYDGIYTTHMRSEGDHQKEAIEEVFRIARESGVRPHISHFKSMGQNNWGSSVETLKMIYDARAKGLEITCDQYPYNAGSTYLAAVLPPFIQSGGPDDYAEKLKSGEVRRRVIDEIENGDDSQWENLIKADTFEGIVISASDGHPEYIGRSIAEIAKTESRNPYDVIFDMVVEEKINARMIEFMMDEKDIRRIMKTPFTMVGSDGNPGFGSEMFHPRVTGSLPRFLGRYVREQGVMAFEEAVRKVTSLPAQTFRVKGKGLLKEGFDADVVILNPDEIMDRGTYENPRLKPDGISYVVVNGEIAVDHGEVMGVTSGKVLCGPGHDAKGVHCILQNRS